MRGMHEGAEELTDRLRGAPTRVVLADDHALMRMMVRRALEEEGFAVVAEAADADAAVGAALDHRPDLCLLDLVMPGDGAEAARRIDNLLPGTRIVMLTASSRDDDLFRCLCAGAMGYLLKDTNPERLPATLREALDGGPSIPRSLVSRLAQEFGDPGRTRGRGPRVRRRGQGLSEGERDVLDLLRAGRAAKEIALELSVPDAAVRRHISSMMRKLSLADGDANR